jgi:hypothetical protein
VKIGSVTVIIYLTEQNKFCPIFNTFYPIWIKFGKGDVQRNDIPVIVIFVKIPTKKIVLMSSGVTRNFVRGGGGGWLNKFCWGLRPGGRGVGRR